MRALLIVILLFIVTACTTTKYIEVEKEVPVEIEKVRTEYINQYYKDSVFIHDSIDRYIAGDTVFLTKYKYIYKYQNRTDTVCKTDSIEVPVEFKTTEVQVQEVEKPLKWYQSCLMYLGFSCICIAILMFVINKYIKKFFK